MKPSFALNLSHDGLSLLRRAKSGWQVIGSVALDDAKLTEKLTYLRKTAAELAGGRLASKLVIPNSEILYRTVPAPGPNDAERAAAIITALQGSTPYSVADLVFDWVDAGDGQAHVAAVARDTLDEAESFATRHRFNPVSFVAIPDGETFVGEPFFGQTGISLSILPEGETVENDPGPIVIVGDHDPDTAPEPWGPDSAGSGRAKGGASAEELADAAIKGAPSAEDLADAAIAQADRAAKSAASGPRPPAERPETGATATFSTKRSDMPRAPDDIPVFQHGGARVTPSADKDQPAKDAALSLGPALSVAQNPESPVTEPGPEGADVFGKLAEKVSEKTGGDDPEPLVPELSELVVGPTAGAPDTVLHDHETIAKDTIAKDTIAKDTGPLRAAPASGPRKKTLIGLTLGLGLVAMILLAVLLASMFFDRPISSTGLLTDFSKPGPSPDLTARQQPFADVGPKGDDANSAAIPLTDAQNLDESELAESDLSQTPLGEITFEEAIVIRASTGVWVLAPIPPVSLEPEQLDDFYVASIDPEIIGQDAVALPTVDPAGAEIPPGVFISPAPAGTLFDLDARGFVRATRQGAVSPDGVLVFLGRPSTRPALRPASQQIVISTVAATLQPPKRRPTLRPANLIENYERTQFGGRTRRQLAAIRPVVRPLSPQQAEGVADQTPTALAVLDSRAPSLRPANFASVVANVRAAQAAAAVVAAEAAKTPVVAAATAASTPASKPASKPAVAAAKVPKIPTTASVAREATIANVIHLAKVNLIGVYGSSGTRRALVRLKNGRYVKVQVGDRLDGGKVAAISGGKLQYIKAGRMLTLDIAS